MLLREYAGFHELAIEKWGDFKSGYEHAGMEPNSNLDNSCYICFNPASSPSDLAATSFRVIQLLNSTVEISYRLSKSFAVLVASEMFTSQAVVCDILGGILFRRSENLLVIPESSDYLASVKQLLCSHIRVEPIALLERVSMTCNEAAELMRVVLCLTLVRDIVRIFRLDNRSMPQDLVNAIDEIVKTVPHFSKDWRHDEMITSYLDGIKTPIVDFDIQNEWEASVIHMYNRPVPRRQSKPMALRSSRSGRKSTALKDNDVIIDQESTALVVDNWLQCDTCSKWRVVNSEIARKFENETFLCVNANKTCSDPSED